MSILDRFRKKQDKKKLDEKPSTGLKLKSEDGLVKKETSKETTVKASPKKDDTKEAYRFLQSAVVTEKATNLAGISKYAFRVSNDANKIEVAKAIYHVYGVKPLAINMICMRGKNVRHGRTSGKTKNWKKAIVTLKPGEKIEIYEGV